MEKENYSSSFDEVKSKAVVQYSVPWPAKFVKLQCNTDLNLPPSNWLSNAFDSYGLQHVLFEQQGFSSFRMAHMFPDCVGEVDVVSDAENIKNLLKIPYHKGVVSMMVHRIENTLLLDNFDIYKYLLRTAETEWEWLKRFFYDHFKKVNREKIYDSNMYFKNRSRKALQEKNLVSKFLYHSIVEEDCDGNLNICDMPVMAPILAEPSPEELPDPDSDVHQYNRTVKWTFEDIQMLIGSDMPIFGQGTHPCISLRLRDMSKPINVLTGIDYWLDNLMANVPEVVMCYHINGIVQKYELIKTEDLPQLDNSKFSPNVIREVAKSILSFLKTNATKAGHTYWLFKSKDQDVVKLYDLTSLCSKYMEDKDENPFTTPVAMLLYRVARNMKNFQMAQQPGTIRMLLKNCIKLLDEKKFPEIVTSSHYMLSDLFIPADTNPEAPNFDQQGAEETDFLYEDDDELPGNEESEDDIKTLTIDSNNIPNFSKHFKRAPPIIGSVEERCLQSISHVIAGLTCLQYFPQSKDCKKPKSNAEEEITMAKPFEPIPMPFHKNVKESETNDINASNKSTKKNKKKKDKTTTKNIETKQGALLLKAKIDAQPLPTWQEFNDHHISWKNHLKILLYEKAELVYATLAEHQFCSSNYGASLRNLGLLVRCHEVLSKLYRHSKTLMEDCLLGRAGDCCIMIVKNWHKVEQFQKDFATYLEEDHKMKEQLEQDEQRYNVMYEKSNLRHVLIYQIRNVEQMLLKGVELYNEALKYGASESIMLRLGNSLNEVSNFYLNSARNQTPESMIFEMCFKAEKYLKQGLDVFEKIKNESNVALLYANMGHLHRLLAHASSPTERHELTNKEKLHYNKAFMNYKKALNVLVDRSTNPGIWDLVKWELSSALFSMATILHDQPNPALSRADAEKEVSETLHQALKYCDLDDKNPKYPLYQFRAGLLHYRLACLNHSGILNLQSDNGRKTIVHLAKLHYEKASNLFFLSMDSINYFTSQMQKFALLEHLSESSTSSITKLAYYQECLEVLCDVQPMLQLIIDKKIEMDLNKEENSNTVHTTFKSLKSLINLVCDKIQCTLRNLTKLCLLKPPINKDCIELGTIYKTLYASTLTLDSKQDLYNLIVDVNKNLLDILPKIGFTTKSS